MLLANTSAARAVSRAFPRAALLRRHPPPQPPRKLRELEALGERLVGGGPWWGM